MPLELRLLISFLFLSTKVMYDPVLKVLKLSLIQEVRMSFTQRFLEINGIISMILNQKVT